MYCSKCSTELNTNALFCHSCGNPIQNILAKDEIAVTTAVNIPVHSSSGFIYENEADQTLKELSLFVGRKSDYYLPKWSKMMSQGKNFSWNWSALLVWPLWMCYRKLYTQLFSILLLQVIASFLFSVTAFRGVAAISVNLGTAIIIAIFANYLYLISATKKIKKIHKNIPANFEQELMKSGGTSKLSVFAGIVALLGWFLFLLSYANMQTTSEASPPAQVTNPVAQQKLDTRKFMNINEQDIIDMLSFYKKDGLTEDKPFPEALTYQNSLTAGFSVALFGKSTHQLTRAVANIDMSSDAAVVYTGRFLKGLFHEEEALKEAMAWTSAQLKDFKKGSTNKGEIYIDGKYLQIINLTVNDGAVLSISAE